MTEAFFANLAVVEVFADGALVTDTFDWIDATAVTNYASVDDIVLWVFVEIGIWVFDSTFKVFALQEVVEDLLGLLFKLVADEILQSLAWNALMALLAFPHALGWNFFLVIHIDVFDWACFFLLFKVRVGRLLEFSNEGDCLGVHLESLAHSELEVVLVIDGVEVVGLVCVLDLNERMCHIELGGKGGDGVLELSKRHRGFDAFDSWLVYG